jgi:hypothetical protein
MPLEIAVTPRKSALQKLCNRKLHLSGSNREPNRCHDDGERARQTGLLLWLVSFPYCRESVHLVTTTIQIDGYLPARATAAVTQLAAPLQATNTARAPEAVAPVRHDWNYGSLADGAKLKIAPYSVTTIVFE